MKALHKNITVHTLTYRFQIGGSANPVWACL